MANNKTNENNTVSTTTQVMVTREQYDQMMAAYQAANQQPQHTSMRGLSFKEEMALAIVGGAFAVAASAIGAFGFAKAGDGLKSFSKSDFASGRRDETK